MKCLYGKPLEMHHLVFQRVLAGVHKKTCTETWKKKNMTESKQK